MKNNSILAALTGVFCLCAAWTGYKVWEYRSSMRALESARLRMEQINMVGPALQSLRMETAEYSKKNPAVTPILQALSNNMARAAAPAPKPARK